MSKPAIKVACAKAVATEGFTRCIAYSSLTKIKKPVKAGESQWFMVNDDDFKLLIKQFDESFKLDVTVTNQSSAPLHMTTHTKDGDELTDHILHGKSRTIKASVKPVQVVIEL